MFSACRNNWIKPIKCWSMNHGTLSHKAALTIEFGSASSSALFLRPCIVTVFLVLVLVGTANQAKAWNGLKSSLTEINNIWLNQFPTPIYDVATDIRLLLNGRGQESATRIASLSQPKCSCC